MMHETQHLPPRIFRVMELSQFWFHIVGYTMARAVSRALAILDAFDRDHPSLSLQEIAQRLSMAKSTAFRLIATLEKEGFLVRKPHQRYSLSLKLVRLAGLVEESVSLRDAARPAMVDVGRQTGETITLSARAHDQRIVIEVVDTPSPLMVVFRPGERFTLFHGASGKMLLAYMSASERAGVLSSPGAPVDAALARLEDDISACRAAGHAVSSGERVPGLTAISVPIFDQPGSSRHCLTLNGPSVRVEPKLEAYVSMMQEAGAVASRRLAQMTGGAHPPSGPGSAGG